MQGFFKTLSWLGLAVGISGGIRATLSAVPTSAPVLVADHGRRPRIVSLVGGVTDTLIALGADSDLVSQSSRLPPKPGSEPKPSIYANERSGAANAEGILALDPDYVFAARELLPCLSGRGLNVVMVPQDTFEGLRTFVLQVGDAVRTPDGARALLDRMDAKIASIRERVHGLPRPRVYYEDGLGGRTRGPGTAVHAMIELAGGDNIYDDGSVPRPTISLETIVAADPEVIVVPSTVTVESVRARQGWEHVSAVRSGRVYSVPLGMRAVSLYSPNCADCCEQTFLRWFHPELFGGDPVR